MGAQPIQAVLLISYSVAIGSTVGRLVFGRLADCQQLSQFYLWQTGRLRISVSSTLVAGLYCTRSLSDFVRAVTSL